MGRLGLVLLGLLCAGAAPPGRAGASEAAARWGALTAEAQARLLAESRERPLTERVLAVSARFLDTPYVVSPLGEGRGVDPDPLFRADAVDCLTFVEQTLALALSGSLDEVGEHLAQLRYDGEVAYADRNHLMEVQWLPANQRKGFLRDITRQVGGAQTVRVEKVLTSLTWQSLSSQALALPAERQVTGRYGLDMVPLEVARARIAALPEGSILVVVREDRPLKATRITHLGFVVRRGKRTYLRHAARGIYGRVVDEDLETFLLRNSRYTKWPVSGVAVFLPGEPPPAPGRQSAAAEP